MPHEPGHRDEPTRAELRALARAGATEDDIDQLTDREFTRRFGFDRDALADRLDDRPPDQQVIDTPLEGALAEDGMDPEFDMDDLTVFDGDT